MSTCHSRQPVIVVNYNINAANCNVLTMMQYVHCLRNINNHSTAICRQRLPGLDIEVEYFYDVLFITRAANSNSILNLNSNSKKLGYFAELELELEKINFLNSNKIVRVH